MKEVEPIRTTRHILPNIEMTFRINTMDFHTIANVIYDDEYQLPLNFCANDMVVDIGANIGCFAAMCLARGSRKVWCIEPDKDNFALLKKNLEWFKGIRLVNRAVWAKGVKEVDLVNMHWYTSQHRVFDTPVQGSTKVRAISLRTLVHFGGIRPKTKRQWDIDRRKGFVLPRRNKHPVRLVKIDAEGAEWPILLSAERELYNIKELMVELHPSLPVKGYDCTPEAVTKHLENHGFKVVLRKHEGNDNIHLRAQSLVTGDQHPDM